MLEKQINGHEKKLLNYGENLQNQSFHDQGFKVQFTTQAIVITHNTKCYIVSKKNTVIISCLDHRPDQQHSKILEIVEALFFNDNNMAVPWNQGQFLKLLLLKAYI